MLVIGAEGFGPTPQENSASGIAREKSNKLKHAEELNAQQRSARPIQIVTEEEFCRLAGVPTAGTLKQQYHAMRDLLARYRALREDHLRYLVKCGVLRPVLRTNADTFFAFPDVAAIKQANESLAQGGSFRSVVRALIAMRQGQLEFDFRLDAAPAKIISLRRHRTERQPPSPQMPEGKTSRHDSALAEEYFRAGIRARRWRRVDAGGSGGRLPKGARARSVSRRRADQPREHPLQPRRARGSRGAVYARDRPRGRLLRGALQSRQHLPRPRPPPRIAGLLSRGAASQSLLRRRALLSGGDVREDGAVTGSAAALALLSAARAARRVGGAGEGVLGVDWLIG